MTTKRLHILCSVLAFTLLFASCTNLPVHEAKQKSTRGKEKFSGYYNNEHNLVYDIYRDSNYVYLEVSTSDITSQIKILKLGFTVWIDPSGKKNQNKGFIYPSQNQLKDRSPGNQNRNTNIKIAKGEHPQQQAAFSRRLYRQFKQRPAELILIGFRGSDSRQGFRPNLQETVVDPSIKMDSMGTMLYEARIPIDTIVKMSNTSDSTFSLGLVSGALNFEDEDMDDTGADVTQGSGLDQRGRRGRGRTTPGRRGPGQRNRPGGRPGQGQPRQQQESNSLSEQKKKLTQPINIWFQVDL